MIDIIGIVTYIIVFSIIIGFFWWFGNQFVKFDKERVKSGMPEKARKLNEKEAEFFADYLFNLEWAPDEDGYMSTRIIPEEVMEIYRKKYGKIAYGEDYEESN